MLNKGIKYFFALLLCLLMPHLDAGHKKNPKPAEAQKKVALLFLTCGDLNHTQLWKSYLAPHLDKFNIYIHPKVPLEDPFFAKFTVSKRVQTSWHHHIKAEKILLTQAYENGDNYKFVLLSESCIPLVDAETFYHRLVSDEKSYFYWTHGGWWNPNHPREITELPPQYRKGNHQWFTLNRKHAECCVRDSLITNIIAKHPHDSESYPATVFAFYGCADEVVNFGFTYVDWSRPGGGGAHPYTFTHVNDVDTEVLRNARRAGHLIGRKFAKEYPTEALQNFIAEPLTDPQSSQSSTHSEN